jgi:hypothetical protein
MRPASVGLAASVSLAVPFVVSLAASMPPAAPSGLAASIDVARPASLEPASAVASILDFESSRPQPGATASQAIEAATPIALTRVLGSIA